MKDSVVDLSQHTRMSFQSGTTGRDCSEVRCTDATVILETVPNLGLMLCLVTGDLLHDLLSS